ncbi:MAG: 4-demethylwyosine synthase TYW1 [Candidatus Hadarchaeales archaeon]
MLHEVMQGSLQERLKRFEELYLKQGYRLVGRNSAVKICLWTKKSLLGKGECYKSKFYGISSWRCLQFTPSLFHCTHQCLFCWRKVEATLEPHEELPPDDPGEVVEKAILAQRELLSGFKGNPKVNLSKWEEAQLPRHAAISLAGEPTLYPLLTPLLEEFHRRGFTTFLVSNGTIPERLKELGVEPTQLYLTLPAPDEATYSMVCRPRIPDGWKKLNLSLELLSSFSCRKVLRLTLVRGLNLKDPEGYAKLIEKANPDYVEPKGYFPVGYSRQRLGPSLMPTHQEIRSFAEELEKLTNYRIADEVPVSSVVLMKR